MIVRVFYSLCIAILGISCQPQKQNITPAEFAQQLVGAIKTGDSAVIRKLIPTREKSLEAMHLMKTDSDMIKAQLVFLDNPANLKLNEAQILHDFGSIIRFLDSSKIDRSNLKIDTVEFENIVFSSMPFIYMNGTAFMNNKTLALKMVKSVLMPDGWNIGEISIVKVDSSNIASLQFEDTTEEGFERKRQEQLRKLDSMRAILRQDSINYYNKLKEDSLKALKK